MYLMSRKFEKGVNDLATWCKQNNRQDLLDEWNIIKNGELIPSMVPYGAGRDVWWQCSLGHEWIASVNSRTGKGHTGCPFCSGRKVLTGYNDLCTLYPDIAKEWHNTKNGDLKPTDFTCGSNVIVWWKCSKGHEWQAMVNSRTGKNGHGCPICSGRITLDGFNDFKTWCIENNKTALLNEWDYDKNSISPSEISPMNSKKVWWRCPKGHSYDSSIGSRTGKDHSGCPYCAGKKALSGYNDLYTNYPDIAKEWHPSKNGDIKPTDVVFGSSIKVWWQCSLGHEWQAAIHPRTAKGVGCPYCANKKVLSGYNDLAFLRPELAQQWNYEKNKGLVDGNAVDISTPDKVTLVSGNKVWWKCSNGHEWQSTVAHRTSRNDGCPYCYGRYVIVGENDLQTLCPEIAKEWHPTKNNTLTPSDVTSKSEKKVWWKCSKGHEWIATIAHRTNEGNGCPYCSGRYAIKGVNDFATWCCQNNREELLSEWDYDKNKDLKPEDCLPGSEKKVWWKCSKGHEWQTLVAVRVLGSGCPRCSGVGTSLPEQGVAFYLEKVCNIEQRFKIAGQEIDIYLPEYKIGIEYDGRFYHKPERFYKELEKNQKIYNEGVKLIRIKESDKNTVDYGVIYYSTDYLGSNYEWAIRILLNQLAFLSGNEDFSNIDINIKRDLLEIRQRLNLFYKENSIAVKKPELLKEWNYDKNGGLDPEMFSCGVGTKVWWKCSKGHEWQSGIANRVKGSGCPYCSGRYAIKGVNDLVTWCKNNDKQYILDEWDYDSNDGLTPEKFTFGSHKLINWKCKNGHKWSATIKERTKFKGNMCPECRNNI